MTSELPARDNARAAARCTSLTESSAVQAQEALLQELREALSEGGGSGVERGERVVCEALAQV